MGEFLVHAKHVAYLTAANTDVACGHILVGTYVTVKFSHECLAETHHLGIALATWVEVAATLGATHRKRGEGVLEGLLKSEEFQNGEVH